MNIVFLSGEAQPLMTTADDRRYFVALDYETYAQPRLFIGPFQLVQAPAASRHAQTVWVLPGGDRATTAQLLVLARRRGWKRPRVIEVTVRRRVSVTG